MRIFFNYQRFDAGTVYYLHLMPRMDEFVDLSRYAVMFATLFASADSWFVKIEDVDRDKITFTSCYELNLFVHMPNRLEHEQDTLQRAAHVIFAAIK